MKIDFEKYIVYPYTIEQLRKKYSKEMLEKYDAKLAFLYQNGYEFNVKNIEELDEQFWLFNGLETFEDFEEIKNLSAINNKPTDIGYKMADSILEILVRQNSFATTKFIDLKKMGFLYKDNIQKFCKNIGIVLDSSDFEIVKVKNLIFDGDAFKLLEDCKKFLELEKWHLSLITFQELYKKVGDAHRKCQKALSKNCQKGILSRVSNLNDELYGSSGYYDNKHNKIKAINGSAVFELKTLCDKNKTDDELKFKMLVLAKDCIKSGETDKSLTCFVKNNTKIAEARKCLADIAFNGIMVLLELKHGISLVKEKNSLDAKKAENLLTELSDICKYADYSCKAV